jgi:RHS repeat-associated protein
MRASLPTIILRVISLALATAALRDGVADIVIPLDDHSQRPWYDAPRTAFDYVEATTINIVTGTPKWPFNNVDLTNVRIIDDQGRAIVSSINIPKDTPLGTVVRSFQWFGEQGQFDAIGTPTDRIGFPHHIETYYGDPHPYVGDVVGGGWTLNYTKSGDGGYNGCDPGCGVLKSGGGTQTWTVYAGPVPTPGPNTTCLDEHVGGTQDGCPGCHGMARYSIHSMLVSLNIQDTPFRHSIPYGAGGSFTVTYNQRESQQPSAFFYSNLGPKWTFNWLSYVSDNPNLQIPLTGVYTTTGGAEIFSFDYDAQSFRAHPQSHATLVKTGAATYERRMPDGSKQVFGLSDGATAYPRRIFMTQMIDAMGNAAEIGYDSSFRVTSITAAGQTMALSYELTNDPLKITQVSDEAGRTAHFEYENGLLKGITDQIGIQSQFAYYPNTDSIASMTTPYGTTTFESGEDGTTRWIEATDPLGGKERVEYREQTSTISPSDPDGAPAVTGITNAALDLVNTFYWDKKAMMVAPGDYTKAQITHWLRNADGSLSGIPSSKKQPFENRVWYTYADQPDYQHAGPSANPSQIARFVSEGATRTTQLSQFEYNNLGKTTKTVDPLGRVTSYSYHPNQIDLFEIRQTTGPNNELLRQFPLYNSLHEPLTEIDAAGQPTYYTYNAQGLILTRENARHETTTYAYGGSAPNGYLESITSPTFNGVSAVTTFGYDGPRRVVSVTNEADQYMVTTDYDALDRKTMVTYPDGTFEQFQYTDNITGAMTLDLTGSSDRLGRWTFRHYDANQHMDSITDPLNRTTIYGWCTCGSLTSIEDPNHNVTTFNRDIQSRVYQKVFADSSTIDYLFEGQTAPNTAGATSRLKSSTDANGQTTNYTYFADDNLQQVSYSNALHPTPTVTYSYDPNYNRIASMTDGIGLTQYTYYPVAVGTLGAGQLHLVDGPFANDTITYAYDELGRTTGQDIDGTGASMTYDSLGRLGTTTNALGSFTRVYDGVTPRLLAVNYPNGQIANYTYYDNDNDRRLQTLQYVTGNDVNLSSHEYTYDAEGQIQRWSKLLGATPTSLLLEHDDANQLIEVSQPGVVYGYTYDDAGNRLVSGFRGAHNVHGAATYTANNLNQLDSVVNNRFGPTETDPVPLTYDRNGNLTYDGVNQTLEWDAANRLVAINYTDSGSRTEFAYDGLGRRLKIIEKGPGLTAVVQPLTGSYSLFTTAPVTLSQGNYTIRFEGLDPNGTGNIMLLDQAALNGVLVPDGGFENPVVHQAEFNPSETAWTYDGASGVTANGSKMTLLSPESSPEGNQVAFIQAEGAISQSLNLNGTYTLSFAAIQLGDGDLPPADPIDGAGPGPNGTYQQIRVTVERSVDPTTVKTFVWCGNQICEERDATGATVTKRYFAEGEQRLESDSANYYYTRDHLGSIREVTTSLGSVLARYDYDAWGRSLVLDGSLTVDFGYTGHYFHQKSGLNLAMYRVYSPTMGRWISRDPIGEADGLNLYRYGRNDPVNERDPTGLAAVPCSAAEVSSCRVECEASGGEYAGCTANAGFIFGVAIYRFHFCICKRPKEKVLDRCVCSCASGKQYEVTVPKGSPCPPNVQNVIMDFQAGPDGKPVSCPKTETCPCAKLPW